MKKILLLLFLILLTSCKGEEKADYLLTPHELDVTLCHREVSLEGTLKISPDEITFLPDSPEGLRVTVNADGGEVCYGDMVFGNEAAGLTRLMPLYTELTEGNLNVVFDGERPEAIVGRDFKITIHKEIHQ